MSESFKIGSTKLGQGGYTPRNYFKLERGINVYRVLPPVHSLAEAGQVSKFYAIHGGFKNGKGKICHFQCVEEKDRKTKVTLQRCAVCDLVATLEAKSNAAKEQGADLASLKKFRDEHIFPISAQKSVYLNVLNQAGQVGVLAVPYKAFKSFEELFKKYENEGEDITGMDGYYLTWNKQSAYKGDNQVNYFVDVLRESYTDAAGNKAERKKTHTITKDVIDQLSNKAYDLGNLYRTIMPTQIDALVAAQGAERTALVDAIFSASTREETGSPVALSGTSAELVTRPEFNDGGLDLVTPKVPANFGQAKANPTAAVTKVQEPVVQTKVAPKPVQLTTTDEDFLSQFSS
jgi:hypothetical protein